MADEPNDPYGFSIVSGLGVTDDLSDPERERYRSSLVRYGLPLALTGLAYALGKKGKQGPEAAVSALTGYLQGAYQAGLQRKAENERKKAQQAQFLQTMMPMLTPEAQAIAAGRVGGMLGVNTQGLQIQNPVAEENRRKKSAFDEKVRLFTLETGFAGLKSGRLDEIQQGVEMIGRAAPEYADFAQKLGRIASQPVEAQSEAQKILLQKLGAVKGPADMAELAGIIGQLPEGQRNALFQTQLDLIEGQQRTAGQVAVASMTGAWDRRTEAEKFSEAAYRAKSGLDYNPAHLQGWIDKHESKHVQTAVAEATKRLAVTKTKYERILRDVSLGRLLPEDSPTDVAAAQAWAQKTPEERQRWEMDEMNRAKADILSLYGPAVPIVYGGGGPVGGGSEAPVDSLRLFLDALGSGYNR